MGLTREDVDALTEMWQEEAADLDDDDDEDVVTEDDIDEMLFGRSEK